MFGAGSEPEAVTAGVRGHKRAKNDEDEGTEP